MDATLEQKYYSIFEFFEKFKKLNRTKEHLLQLIQKEEIYLSYCNKLDGQYYIFTPDTNLISLLRRGLNEQVDVSNSYISREDKEFSEKEILKEQSQKPSIDNKDEEDDEEYEVSLYEKDYPFLSELVISKEEVDLLLKRIRPEKDSQLSFEARFQILLSQKTVIKDNVKYVLNRDSVVAVWILLEAYKMYLLKEIGSSILKGVSVAEVTDKLLNSNKEITESVIRVKVKEIVNERNSSQLDDYTNGKRKKSLAEIFPRKNEESKKAKENLIKEERNGNRGFYSLNVN